MIKIFNSIWSQHKFILSRSVIVISASILGNALAYLFQLRAGRYLSIEDYGRLTSLFSLSAIIPLLVSVFTGAIPKIVAEIKDRDYPHRISHLFFNLLYFQSIITFTILILMFIFSKQIGNYLNINDTLLIQLFSFAVAAGILISFLNPFLQGLLRFKAYSFTTFLASLTKLMVIEFIIYFSLGLKDIFTGLAITTIFVGIISTFILKKNLLRKFTKIPNVLDFNTLIKYSTASAAGMIGLIFIQNIDLIEVKHLFDESTAGIYGSTGVIGKIIFYAASPVAIIMLPICSEKFKNGQNFIKPFLTSLLVGAAIGLCGTLIYTFFPAFITNLLFGSKYIEVIRYLPAYAIYTFVYTIMYFLCLFLISISKFKLSSLPLLTVAIQYIGIEKFAHNLNDVIYISTIAVTLVTIPLIISVYKLAKDNQHAN